jgi:hypothetical protein
MDPVECRSKTEQTDANDVVTACVSDCGWVTPTVTLRVVKQEGCCELKTGVATDRGEKGELEQKSQ